MTLRTNRVLGQLSHGRKVVVVAIIRRCAVARVLTFNYGVLGNNAVIVTASRTILISFREIDILNAGIDGGAKEKSEDGVH